MSFNDRPGRNFSRDLSSGGKRAKGRGGPGRRAASSKWVTDDRTRSGKSEFKKSSQLNEWTCKDNSENVKESRRDFKNRRNSIDFKKSKNGNSKSFQGSLKGDRFSKKTFSEKNKTQDFDKKQFIPLPRKNQLENHRANTKLHPGEEKVVYENESNDIFWGRHSTQSILESGRPVHRIWCTSEIRSSSSFFQLIKDAKSLGVLVEEVSWARLGHVTKGGVHQGIAIQTAAAETFDLKTLVDGCKSVGESPVLIAVDGLTDPQNLGAIVRSAEAFGAHGIVLPQRRSAGLTGSVAKVAAGALEHLPVARVVNLNRALEELKDFGYTVVGLAEEGDKTINEFSFDGAIVLVIGSEGKGLSLLTRRHCDVLLRIPLRGVTSSLNASVASSICLYEIARQGWMKGLSGQDPSPKSVKAKLFTRPMPNNKLD